MYREELSMRKERRNKQSGFTLIELMVVVGIIGILAVVAIPSYRNYQAKSRTVEAKLALSSARKALAAFHMENDTYTSCLNAAAYGASSGNKYYSIGFGPTASVAANCNSNTCNNPLGAPVGSELCSSSDGETYFVANKGFGGTPTTQSDLSSSTVSTNTFKLFAAGRISGSGNLDIWSIDQDGNLVHEQVGY